MAAGLGATASGWCGGNAPSPAPLLPGPAADRGRLSVAPRSAVSPPVCDYLALPFLLQAGGREPGGGRALMTPWPLTVALAGPLPGRWRSGCRRAGLRRGRGADRLARAGAAACAAGPAGDLPLGNFGGALRPRLRLLPDAQQPHHALCPARSRSGARAACRPRRGCSAPLGAVIMALAFQIADKAGRVWSAPASASPWRRRGSAFRDGGGAERMGWQPGLQDRAIAHHQHFW